MNRNGQPATVLADEEEEEVLPTHLPPRSTYVHERTKIQTGDQAADIPLPLSGPSSAGSGGPVRINPRTGKPITLPAPLSLVPHDPSPIQEEARDPANGGQLIREEHEEVSCDTLSHHPNS